MRRRYGVRGVVVVAVLLVLSSCDWLQPRMDPARTANNPLSGLSASNVSTLRQVWSTSGNPGVALVANGVVLPASTLGGVFTTRALNVSDGSVRWTSDVVFGAVDGNVAYGVGPNGLTAASIGNGQLLWSATTSGFSVVGATDGKVLVRGAEAPRGYYFPEIQVWDASTHRELWTFYDTDDHTPPAVANGVGYFVQVPAPPTPADPSLHAVDLADGHERWSISLRRGCQITGPVVTWTPFSLSVQVARVCRFSFPRQVSATSCGVR